MTFHGQSKSHGQTKYLTVRNTTLHRIWKERTSYHWIATFWISTNPCFDQNLPFLKKNLVKRFFFSWLYCKACGILAPSPGIEPVTFALEACSLSIWTAREVPRSSLKWFKWVLEEKPYVYIPASREQAGGKKVKCLCRKGFASCIFHSHFLARTWSCGHT